MASDSNAKAATKSSCCGGGGTGAAAGLRPPEQGLNCPRCDSLNTKFCYYNNYSLTQPRHFCKSCRRYWTKGGALRNVPVGGGCRKNRKSKSSSNLSVSSSSSSSLIHPSLTTEPSKAFAQTASTDFHLNSFFPFSIAAINTTASMSSEKTIGGYNSIASSIESLSSINQDLHWRLQQQRMQLLFEGQQPQHKDPGMVSFTQNQVEPSSFAMAENNKGEIFIDTPPPNGTHKTSDTGTAWFLDGAFALPPPPSAINAHGSINIGASATDWNGIAASWSDVQHFTSLP